MLVIRCKCQAAMCGMEISEFLLRRLKIDLIERSWRFVVLILHCIKQLYQMNGVLVFAGINRLTKPT